MRITNSLLDYNTNLAKCSKMTEGEHRIHGMNGVTDSGNAAIKEESPHTSSDAYNLGGRLKFFKNGRFILELARAREGEKVAWVPVQKKTFWPPQGSASSISTYRQESSTSLSVSDDNSSVQSSPWQRDHTWKQTSPQRNASSHLSFYFAYRKHRTHRASLGCWQHRLSRSPYTPDPQQTYNKKCNNSRCINKSAISRPSLVNIVQLLWNKSLQALNSITSPRKRILREMERVTIDDLSYKRCRGKVNQNQSQSVTAKTTPILVNGNATTATIPSMDDMYRSVTPSAKNSSYSITSLLSVKPDIKEEKLSSQNIIPHPAIKNLADSNGSISSVGYTTPDTVDGIVRPADILSGTHSMVTGRGRSPSSPITSRDNNYHRSPQSHPPPPPPLPPSSHTYSPAYMPPFPLYSMLGPAGYVPAYYGTSPYYSNFLPPPITHHYSWTTHHPSLDTDDSDVPLNLSKHAD